MTETKIQSIRNVIQQWVDTNAECVDIETCETILSLIDILQTNPKQKNELIFDQLQEMDGEPVYLVIGDIDPLKIWALVEVSDLMGGIFLTNKLGGRTVYCCQKELDHEQIKVYRHPPEE